MTGRGEKRKLSAVFWHSPIATTTAPASRGARAGSLTYATAAQTRRSSLQLQAAVNRAESDGNETSLEHPGGRGLGCSLVLTRLPGRRHARVG